MRQILSGGGGSGLKPDGTPNVPGYVRPIEGPQTQSRNRNMPSLGATHQVATWPAGADITYLTFIAVRQADTSFAVGATTDEPYAIVTIDAANTTEDAANIGISGTPGAPPAALTTDGQYFIIPLNTPISMPLTEALSAGTGGRVTARCSSNTAGELIDLFIGAN